MLPWKFRTTKWLVSVYWWFWIMFLVCWLLSLYYSHFHFPPPPSLPVSAHRLPGWRHPLGHARRLLLEQGGNSQQRSSAKDRVGQLQVDHRLDHLHQPGARRGHHQPLRQAGCTEGVRLLRDPVLRGLLLREFPGPVPGRSEDRLCHEVFVGRRRNWHDGHLQGGNHLAWVLKFQAATRVKVISSGSWSS